MKKLLVFLRDYKKESIIAPLFKMLEALFDLLVPLVVASIINKGIKYSDKTYIYQMCGVLILLAVVGLVCALCAQYFAAKAAGNYFSAGYVANVLANLAYIVVSYILYRFWVFKAK